MRQALFDSDGFTEVCSDRVPELLQEKHPAAVWHLLDALKRFDSLDPRRVGEITFEVAHLGENGLDYANPEKKYTLSAYPSESFLGLQLMCLMYMPDSNASFPIRIPAWISTTRGSLRWGYSMFGIVNFRQEGLFLLLHGT